MNTTLSQVQIAIARRSPRVDREHLFHPDRYLPDVLGVRLEGPFRQLVDDVALAWLHLHQREASRRGTSCPHREDLPDWDGVSHIPNVFSLAGGHKLGKSVVVSALLAWVAHVSPKLVGCVYAPKVEQASGITWRYFDGFLSGRWGGNPSRLAVMRGARTGGATSPALRFGLDRSIRTQSTDAGVKVQGSHEAVGIHVFEEAEGIEDEEVFDAVRSLTSDGVSLWFLCANPASSSSPFARLSGDRVHRYEMSCLDHPNVSTGRIVVPGAVTREWVEAQLSGRSAWAVRVDGPDPDRGAFELSWRPSEWWVPRPPWYWRVWGVAPPTTAADAAVSSAVLRAASRRDFAAVFRLSDPTRATLGVDCARGGEDAGCVFRRWRGCLEQRAIVHDRETGAYLAVVVEELSQLLKGGCREVEVRVDAGGGYGGGLVDALRDSRILDLFTGTAGGRVIECHFGGSSYDQEAGADWASCAYLDTGEALHELALVGLEPELEEDLCSRRVRWVVRSDGDEKRDVRQLERKEEFRRRLGRSPDRGDAAALACARWPQSREVGGVTSAYGRKS